jgi:membrane dipeptidase
MREYPAHDLGSDAAGWARALGISREAVDIYLAGDVIDLHVDTFIWTRLVGYDLTRRHGRGLCGARFYSQADLPRLRAARVNGAIWVVTTNPFSAPSERTDALGRNLRQLSDIFTSVPDDARLVRDVAEYRAAVAAGQHAVFLGIQGANALERSPRVLEEFPPGQLVLATLVHLTSSAIGATNSPLRFGPDQGLSARGRELVEWLDAQRIFVDLAHVSPRGFWDAVSVHDASRPLLVSHTGLSGAHPHWRNIGDAELRAVADTGGTVGIMFDTRFLGGSLWGGQAELIVDHVQHVVRTVGDDFVSLGSDWDGAIVTPRDLPTCLELPRLVERMLRRGFGAERIHKVLGGNFLRALGELRGHASSTSKSES